MTALTFGRKLGRTTMAKQFDTIPKPSEGARRLAKLMSERELSHAAIGEMVRVNAATVTRWVNEKRRPDAESAFRIENALGIQAALWGQAPFAANDSVKKAG